MTNRFPLVVNATTNQITEIQSGDDLLLDNTDLTTSSGDLILDPAGDVDIKADLKNTADPNLKVDDDLYVTGTVGIGVAPISNIDLKIERTWNNSATTFFGTNIDITNTASNVNSRLFRLANANVTKFDVDLSGNTNTYGTSTFHDNAILNSGDLITGQNRIAFADSGTVSLLDFTITQFGQNNNTVLSSVKSINFFLDSNGGDSGQAFRIYNNVDPDNLGATTESDYIFKVSENGDVNVTGNQTVSGTTETQQLDVSGVSTFTSDLEVYRTGGSFRNIKFYDDNSTQQGAISQAASRIEVEGTNELALSSNDDVHVVDRTWRTERAIFRNNGAVELYYPGPVTTPGVPGTGVKRFETTAGGVSIDGGIQESFTTLTSSTGTVTHDCSAAQLFYHTSPSANFTVNLTNLALSQEYATTVTIVINQGDPAYMVTGLQIDGSAQTIKWQGNNSAPNGTASGIDVVTFSILNDGGTYVVLAQSVPFGGV